MNRDKYIEDKFRGGATFASIGRELGISAQRVNQIAKQLGLSSAERTKKKRSQIAAKKADGAERRLRKRAERQGLSVDEYKAIWSMPYPNPYDKYKYQRKNAKARGINWELNFGEWWQIWQTSGKWDLRGRFAEGYVMSRVDDLGPYSKDNVRIVTFSENASQSRIRWWNTRPPIDEGNNL